jgi:Mlc titration factor MtfA (ptsG expression regulator)
MTTLIILELFTSGGKLIIGILVAILFITILSFGLKTFEMGYIIRKRKPLYVYNPFFLKKLNTVQKQILVNQFVFYKKLSSKHQRFFEHRVASFIKDKTFVGREEVVVTDEMKVLISSTAVMLTFGFRDFYIGLVSTIFIYPNEFYSSMNETYHKGEFNPKLETLVLSWKDFLQGYDIETDKINLGIHEFAHAIHLNSIKERDVSSTIFSDSFKELTDLLAKEENLRKTLTESRYFRDYAYTNQYEFLAVIIETFIESPSDFKSQFPEIYDKTKQMLNFNFAGY